RLKKSAILALEHSVVRGKNIVSIYDAQMEERTSAKLEAEMKNQRGDLPQIRYQPIFDTSSEQLIGFEAQLVSYEDRQIGESPLWSTSEPDANSGAEFEYLLRSVCFIAQDWPDGFALVVKV